jgi:hypothetical protein
MLFCVVLIHAGLLPSILAFLLWRYAYAWASVRFINVHIVE